MQWLIGSLLVLSALFQAISWQASIGQEAPAPCPCSQFHSTFTDAGGYECAHGPEHNAECRAMMEFLRLHPEIPGFSPADCIEHSGGTPNREFVNPATGQTISFMCKCFECGKPDANGQVNQCEPIIYSYEAGCSIVETPTPGDGCPVHLGAVEEFDSITFKSLYNFNGTPCAYTSGFQQKDTCGGGKVGFSCKQPYGPTTCVYDYMNPIPGVKRKLLKCGPAVSM